MITEFEDCLSALRDVDGIEGGAFGEFDDYVRRTFVGDRLSRKSIILKGPDWFIIAASCELPG